MHTTCVASQNCVSSTACITVKESPAEAGDFGGQQMGDPQRQEARDRRDEVADADVVKPLEKQADQHAAPADEHGRGIQVRHRRAAGNVNPPDQRRRVDDERETQQPECGPVERPGNT